MSAKYRVSSKQRLELVEEAVARFNQSGREHDDYVRLLDDVEEALFEKLRPKNKPAE